MKSLVKIDEQIVKTLNDKVSMVLTSKQMAAFDKAFMMADAIQTLRELLTPELMKPILSLQGSQLGFKTDKDKNGGYPVDVVKDCLITATLQGVLPVQNQFNIISGNTYITKEGFEYLLSNVEGLHYTCTNDLPRIQGDKAAIIMHLEWSMNGGQKFTKSLDFPVKTNQYMGADGVIGKGKRKAYAWLYSHVTGINVPEGSIEDVPFKVVSEPHNESDRFKEMLSLDFDSVEEFQTKVLDKTGDDIKDEFAFEIAEKIESLKAKGGK